jgi:hypothetical protein
MIDNGWRLVIERLVQALMVIELKIVAEPLNNVWDALIVIQIYGFLFDRAPQSPDNDVVKDSATPVHADLDPRLFRPGGESPAGKLCPFDRY